jgi:hypothetical protein
LYVVQRSVNHFSEPAPNLVLIVDFDFKLRYMRQLL